MFSELQIRWSESKHDDLKIWIWSEQICTMQTRWPEDAEGGGIMMDWFDQLTDGLICCGLPVFPTPRGLRGNRYRNPSSPDGPNLVFPPEKGSSTHIRLLQTTHFAEGPFSLNEARLCFVGISSEMKSPPLQKKRERAFPPHSSSNGKNGAHLRFKSLRHMVISCEGIGRPLKSFDPESMKKTIVFYFPFHYWTW